MIAPPSTVGSLAAMTHSTPETTPMPETKPAADGEVGAPAGERAQLEERRVAVEQEFDPFPHEQLAALAVPRDAALAAAGARQRKLRLQLGEQRAHRFAVARKLSEFVSTRDRKTSMIGWPGDHDSPGRAPSMRRPAQPRARPRIVSAG